MQVDQAKVDAMNDWLNKDEGSKNITRGHFKDYEAKEIERVKPELFSETPAAELANVDDAGKRAAIISALQEGFASKTQALNDEKDKTNDYSVAFSIKNCLRATSLSTMV